MNRAASLCIAVLLPAAIGCRDAAPGRDRPVGLGPEPKRNAPPAPRPPTHAPGAKGGCWSLAFTVAAEAEKRVLVRFDTAFAGEHTPFRHARVLQPGLAPATMSLWRPGAADSVHFGMGDPITTLSMLMVLTGDSLHGTTTEISDALDYAPRTGRVAGRRAACPAEATS